MFLDWLKKYNFYLLFVLTHCIAVSVSSQNINTSIQLDTLTLKKSLEGKSPYNLALALYNVLDEDSLKTSIVAKYIENKFLTSRNLKEVGSASITLSIWEEKKGNYEKAILFTDNGIEAAKKIKNDSILYLAYLRKGVYCFYSTDHKGALDAYDNALIIAKKQKNTKREIIIAMNVALIKMQANDIRGAIELLLENLEKVKENPGLIPKSSTVNIYIDLCGAFIKIEDYESAEVFCSKGIQLNEEGLNNPISKAYFLSGFAEIARFKKEFKKCYNFLDESEDLVTKSKGKESILLFIKLYRAKTYYDEQKYTQAIDELLKIEKMKSDHDFEILSIQEMYYYLAKSYKLLGNINESIRYYEKASEIDIQNDKKRAEINLEIIRKYDLAELKEELDAAQEKSESKSIWLIVSIFLSLLLIVGFSLIYINRERQNKKKFEKLLETSNLPNDESEELKPIKIISENDKNYISNAIAFEVLGKLKKFEEKKLYLKKDITLAHVASKLNTNPTYLSKTVNKHKGKSFSNYIKELRVYYVVDRLKNDKKFRLYTIEAIAKEVGYIRAEPFSKSFKLKTGLYPSYFIKELNSQEID